MTLAQNLRVYAIRSQNPRGFGGCIFTGVPIDDQGNVQDVRTYYVVRAPGTLLGSTRVQVGQWWRVTGEPEETTRVVNGYNLTESQIEASNAELLLPSGEHIVTLMAESDGFRGIGSVKGVLPASMRKEAEGMARQQLDGLSRNKRCFGFRNVRYRLKSVSSRSRT